mmetsp:Transcript_72907/g.202302  ORF Transcript_72907/g.202302 Transcript_72907/m.202302 type:complete len:218 (+) Transcript_72907:272-925(+)
MHQKAEKPLEPGSRARVAGARKWCQMVWPLPHRRAHPLACAAQHPPPTPRLRDSSPGKGRRGSGLLQRPQKPQRRQPPRPVPTCRCHQHPHARSSPSTRLNFRAPRGARIPAIAATRRPWLYRQTRNSPGQRPPMATPVAIHLGFPPRQRWSMGPQATVSNEPLFCPRLVHRRLFAARRHRLLPRRRARGCPRTHLHLPGRMTLVRRNPHWPLQQGP